MITLHGVFLVIYQRGVLLQGQPGIGKSACALNLIDRGHRFIADDAPLFYKQDSNVIGKSHERLQNLLEVRGLGIIDVSCHFGKDAIQEKSVLDLVIHLQPSEIKAKAMPESRLNNKGTEIIILEKTIPSLSLQLSFGQNMAILIETAVRCAFSTPSAQVERLLNPISKDLCDLS